MNRTSLSLSLLLLTTTALPALADAPKVVTDIPPVHGLVARVMQGVGEPALLVPPGASPHGYSLRPSDARALSQADQVFWIGEALTPWLEDSIDELAKKAHVTSLLEADATQTLEFRQEATFVHDEHEGHEHDDEHAHSDDHEDHAKHDDHEHHEEHAEHDDHEHHEEHAEHDDHEHHEEHAEHDDHEHHEEHAEHHGHDHHGHSHTGTDPHAWLSPENGKIWLALIAEELSEADPQNAEIYQSNALEAQAEIDGIVKTIASELEQAQGSFVVFHDAYQYFETSFGLNSVGAISLGDASDPSAARIAEIREAVVDAHVTCVFAEPQFKPGLVATVTEGTGARSVVIDPLGTTLATGPDFYPQLLQSLGHNIAGCLAGK